MRLADVHVHPVEVEPAMEAESARKNAWGTDALLNRKVDSITMADENGSFGIITRHL